MFRSGSCGEGIIAFCLFSLLPTSKLWQADETVGVEALAATLYIVGLIEEAKPAEAFDWGAEFLKINQDLLDLYTECANGDEVVAAQNQWLKVRVEKIGKVEVDGVEVISAPVQRSLEKRPGTVGKPRKLKAGIGN